MKITTPFINEILHLNLHEELSFDVMGLSFTQIPGSLSYLESDEYTAEINSNHNITGVLTLKSLAGLITRKGVSIIISDDPRYDFFLLHNEITKRNIITIASSIHPTAKIHPAAFIAENNVVIGARTVVEANAVIYPDVVIGDDCIINAAAIIGKDGFEYKRTSKGVLRVIHDGRAILANRVDIGANTCVDKGFAFRETIIGEDTKIDNLVHVGHGVQIGKRTFIAACAMLGGSTTIGNDVWICPNASLNTYVTIMDGAYVSLGAVVSKDVEAGQQVTGNFAIPHEKFLSIFKASLKDQ